MRPFKAVTRKIILFVLLLIVWPTLSCAGPFRITRVRDGDTVLAEGYDIEVQVRLVGIDAPETSKGKGEPGQPYSDKSKKHLAGLVLNKIVDVKGYGQDRYGRVLGVLYLKGRNINLEMIKAGLAEVYRGQAPRGLEMNPFHRAEEAAKDSKRGMWSQGDKYTSPKEWRAMRREK